MVSYLGQTSRVPYPNITYVVTDATAMNVLLTYRGSQIGKWVSAAYVYCSDRGSIFAVTLCGQREV